MKRLLLAGALAVGLTIPLAISQTSVIYDTLSGNECWNAGQGPGGPSAFLCSNVLRNSTAKVATALSGALTFGTSATLTSLRYGGNALITTQPLVATTFTAPPNPVPDGAIIATCNVTGSAFATTNIAFVANTGQTFNTSSGGATLAAQTCIYYQFNRSNTTWYRIQ